MGSFLVGVMAGLFGLVHDGRWREVPEADRYRLARAFAMACAMFFIGHVYARFWPLPVSVLDDPQGLAALLDLVGMFSAVMCATMGTFGLGICLHAMRSPGKRGEDQT